MADLGFYGNSRNVGSYTVPHFQVMIGGKWHDNGGSYGLAIGSIPSKAIPRPSSSASPVVSSKDRQAEESFQDFCTRIGKKALKATIEDLAKVPPHTVDPDFYIDWGDPREFTIGDMGEGECAGEVVSLADFGFTDAESKAFEAQLLLDDANNIGKPRRWRMRPCSRPPRRWCSCSGRMCRPLPTLSSTNSGPASSIPRFSGTRITTGSLPIISSDAIEGPDTRYTEDTAHKIVEEANLFIDAAHKAHVQYRASLNVLKLEAAT